MFYNRNSGILQYIIINTYYKPNVYIYYILLTFIRISPCNPNHSYVNAFRFNIIYPSNLKFSAHVCKYGKTLFFFPFKFRNRFNAIYKNIIHVLYVCSLMLTRQNCHSRQLHLYI